MKICKFCLSEHISLEKSHVIPNAFWRKLKSQKQGINGQLISIANGKNQLGQDSYTEELLCRNCEQNLSNNMESYSIKLCLHNPSNINISISKKENYRLFSGINYKELKLFQLSILWRASVSTKSFYSQIKLPPNEEERIRISLYNLQPLSEHEYGCIMSPLTINNDPQSTQRKDFIASPYAYRNEDNDFFVFHFGGFEWRFSNPTCSQDLISAQRVITEKGFMNCQLKDVHSDPVLFKIAVEGYANQMEGRGILTKHLAS